jgi:LPS export ABC transporter protein LptC
MAAHTRNLVLFLTLAGAALVTWIFARVAEQPDDSRFDSEVSPQGYYLSRATLLGTDDEGRIVYRVVADRVEQQADGEQFVLSDMRVEYMPDINVRWNIRASRGLALENLEVLDLQEDVRLVYLPDAGQDEIFFEADRLLFDAKDFFASTDLPVTMRRGNAVVTGNSLTLDLNTDAWTLGSTDSETSDVSIRTIR